MSHESWCRKVWAVRSADDRLAHAGVLREGDEFWLEPFIRGDETLFYTVGYEADKMNDAVWNNRKLIPVGDCSCTVSGLPVMTSPPQSQYTVKVKDVCDELKRRPTVKRLEGVITVNGVPEVVRFMSFNGAQSNGRDWFMVQVLKSVDPLDPDEGEEGQARQGGTAHGDPR